MPSSTSIATHDAPVNPPSDWPIACTHCGLPVPRGLVVADAPEQFCCNGCQAVYRVIHDCGLDAYYRLRASSETTQEAVGSISGERYASCDTETYHGLHVQTLGNGLLATDFRLEGVHCAACVWLIEKLPRIVKNDRGESSSQSGVVEARLSFRQATVRVVWDPNCVSLSKIARSLDTLGYHPHPAKGVSRQAIYLRETRSQMVAMGVAGALAGNIMILSVALYGSLWGGMEPQYSQLFRWVSAGLGLISLAWPGRVYFRGAWAAIKTRSPHLDLPIAIALGVGGLAGTVNVILGHGEIYFDSLAVLVFLLLVGRFIQYRQQRRADDAVSLMAALTPNDCRRQLVSGEIEVIPVEALALEDVVEVLPGGVIPVDGKIEHGSANIIAALLTGESLPQPVAPGDPVCAGTQVVGSPLEIRVKALGQDTRVGRLMRLVEEGISQKPQIVHLTDRIAGWFVVCVSLIAVVVFSVWSFIDLGLAVNHTVALLIVACPCALGLATPLTIAVALGRAARRDILIKSGAALERVATSGIVYLDKTGTITKGKMQVLGWHGDESLQPWVAALEAKSTHPIAVALVEQYAQGEKASPSSMNSTEIRVIHEHRDGIAGITSRGRLLVGSPQMMKRLGCQVPMRFSQEAARVIEKGASPVMVALNDDVVAITWVGDEVYEDASRSVAQLQRWGWRVAMLSGDQPAIAKRVGEAVGLDAGDSMGEVTPEAKLSLVQTSQQNCAMQTTMMVGDGVNDAASLAGADVGVAVRGGAEASLAAADVYLARPGLGPLVELVALGRQTMRVIRRNLIVSLFYNALVIGLAAAGLVNPLLAAIIMPLSSALVLALALGGQRAPKQRRTKG